jgi:hypothetical protein
VSENLERDLVAARKRLDGATGKNGQGAENAYGQAYQKLVRAGLRPQLRYKHRCSKG